MRETKKKIILRPVIVLSLLMIALGILFAPHTLHAKSVPWYRTVMKKGKNRGFKYYKRLDINRDGKKEIILSSKKNNFIYDGKVEIWGRVKGKNKLLLSFSDKRGFLMCHKGSKSLILYQYEPGRVDLWLYKLKGGKLKRYKTVGYYQPYHDFKSGGFNKNWVYRVNGKKVKLKKGRKLIKKYCKKKNDLTFKKMK